MEELENTKQEDNTNVNLSQNTQEPNEAEGNVGKVKGDKSNKKTVIIIAIVLILIFLGIIGYLIYIMLSEDSRNGKFSSENNNASTTTTSTSLSSLTTSTSVSTTTTTITPDPYDGWLTYTNDLLGYTVKYPPTYTLDDANEHCVYFREGVLTINIGRGWWNDDFGCFRTGVGAYEIDESTKDYTVYGGTYTADEWYEHYECDEGGYGNIYGRLILDQITLEGSETDFGLEYSCCPKDTFEEEQETVTKIIESVTW